MRTIRLLRHFSSSSSSTKEELARLSDELRRQGAQLNRQEDLLTQLLIRLSPMSGKLSAAAGGEPKVTLKPPPKTKNPRGFLDFDRRPEPYRPAKERLRDWGEINRPDGHQDPLELKRQAARCMDCGTPFCQTNTGCPINNLIPEWNELVLTDRWKGRVCPAPCEGSCVAGVNDPNEAVTIKNVEYAIVDRAFKEGWITPRKVSDTLRAKGGKVAVIGSGPAGLAAADLLNQAGHSVTVFERADRIGGLLMYGIPTMKISKDTVDRRVDLLRQEGITFFPNHNVMRRSDLPENYDATLLAVGACKPRDLNIPGRNLEGVHFAMDFLTKNQKDLTLDPALGSLKNKWTNEVISVRGKNVIVIGGGDTGTDCIGTSIRQYCKSVVNLELMPRPPAQRPADNPWPHWPKIFRTDYGHAEATAIAGRDPRRFALMTKRFLPDASKKAVRGISVVQVEVDKASGAIKEVPNSEHEIQADVVILAMGFVGVEESVPAGFGVQLDNRGNVKAEFGEFSTSVPGVFAAGDCRRGQSLVVWGIREGREAAQRVNDFIHKAKQASAKIAL